jgi:hypothetical protein
VEGKHTVLVKVLFSFRRKLSEVLHCQVMWCGGVDKSNEGGGKDHGGMFGWYIGVREMICVWQTHCIYREVLWHWGISFSALFIHSLV